MVLEVDACMLGRSRAWQSTPSDRWISQHLSMRSTPNDRGKPACGSREDPSLHPPMIALLIPHSLSSVCSPPDAHRRENL
jgi:hypothetical protein